MSGWPGRWRGWIWFALAFVMYVSGRKDLRRGALRGLMAMVLTRVAVFAVPPLRAHQDFGATAAFLTGAAIELPTPVAPVAAGLSALDVLRGEDRARGAGAAVIAAAVAAGTIRVWPVRPTLGLTAPKVWLPAQAEPNEDGDGLSIVVNKASGDDDEPPPTEALRAAFPKAEIVEVEITTGAELRKALDEAVSNNAIALGVCGGDGSINTAAQVALDAGKALMVIPGGTFNHLTGALGIESVDDAIEAVKRGEAVGVDVATIGGQVFLNTASFGSYVELVDARERLEHRIGKWPAVISALIWVLRHSEPIEIEIEGETKEVWMAFIGNCRYHPSGFAPSWRERLDDGLLDFRYVSGSHPWARSRLIAAVLTGRLGRSKVYRQVCVERLMLRSPSGPLRLARDGETFEGPDDVVIEKLDKRLTVYVPHAKHS